MQTLHSTEVVVHSPDAAFAPLADQPPRPHAPAARPGA
jgi:hypothetical protein